MSARALEFVETWVSEQIEEQGYPEEGEDSPAKEWAAECLKAAGEEGIPKSEIDEAFDDLTEFIDGEIEEAREREEDEEDGHDEDDEEEDGDEEDDDEDEDEDDEDDKDEDDDEEDDK
jgi:hypothetical protein